MERRATHESGQAISRRRFMQGSALSMAALGLGGGRLFAAGSDTIRVGLIGCGSRGMGAVRNCVDAAPNVEIVALGDLFKDRIDTCLKTIKTNGEKDWSSSAPWAHADKVKVTPETCFTGFEAYKKVINSGVDLVILATSPHFRPMHLKAAIEAGKHVFMEKPVAVDPVGIRSVLASSELARQKGLAIGAGTQRRHDPKYVEVIKRVHNGEIGELVAGQCYWVQGWVRQWGFYSERQPQWTDMETQCRNWYYYTWLSGDHIVEQHVHNLDVINWAMGTHPVMAMGMGGREVRIEPEFGNIYDHFAVEYEYPNGARILSMARQIAGCTERIAERIVGAKGIAMEGAIEGARAYKYDGPTPNPYEQEHTDLIRSIRNGRPLNEGKAVAESTMTAILGRMSAYTGRAMKWDWAMKSSKLDLTPPRYELGDLPVGPVAVPGKTPLV
ncbi:Gfo/Idh/MocA family protein [Anaerobaca lacustris]|uniref:Gfo/Idh/MocA family oxidoreductase n=1 Tax=Anaerobaca lacustris TaxID=3044600 RepID=A0AAW6U046_9BACT|nr:Gfo/Idh/MocA family oxidoreductase [Sedimentisphaerales bacterium M17dextr]